MASAYPGALARLIDEFRRLPGIGAKSAERLAFFSLKRPPAEVEAFSRALTACVAEVRPCPRCFCLAEEDRCGICDDPRRDRSRVCVVEGPRDVFVLERSGAWRGLYHVLGGLLSPLDGIGPEDLHLAELMARAGEGITELVLALPPSTEGEATGALLALELEGSPVSVTRIAYGLPVGAELEFADPVTLARALEGRRGI